MRLGTKNRDAGEAAVVAGLSGLCAGTTVMTMDGEIPVEHLTEGDRIITRDSGMAVLRRITAVTCKTRTVRIKAGSLGHTRPDRDMIVAPQAQIHIRDWRAEALFGSSAAIVSAGRLVDGEFLSFQEPRDTTFYTLEFDRQHILYADGLEIASGTP